MDTNLLLFLILSFSAIVGYLLGKSKGQPAAGTLAGLVGGPVGCLMIIMAPDVRRKCTFCKGPVPKSAVKCMHCASDLP